MKKKLIAIVISALLAGGIGSSVLYNNYVEKTAAIESAQINEDESTVNEPSEDIMEEDIQEVVENNENVQNDDIIEKSNSVVEVVPVQKSEAQAVQNQSVNKTPAKEQAQSKPQTQQVVQNTASDSFMSQVEQLIYNKVNAERSARGVSQLSYNTTMQKYARIKSQDMGDKNYFDHKDLSGNLITVKMKNDGVSFNAWGENIAYIGGVSDPNQLAQQFMTNWMNSEGHRENILSTNFNSIGIGVYKVGNKVYATQEFYR